MRRLDEAALRRIVLGAGLLGSGGGGSVREGMKLVERVLEFSPTVGLMEPDEAADELWGAVIAGMGSPIASLTRVRTWSPLRALEQLEREEGFTSSYVIPFELGAGNSLNPMLAAVQKGIPMIDGDPCGRAVPQVDMTTFFLGGMPISPFTLTTEDDIAVTLRTKRPADIERIARAITSEFNGVSATSCHAMQAADMKRLIIPGTTTLVERIGSIILNHLERGADPAEEIADLHSGRILGCGQVAKIEVETRGGFDFGIVSLKGQLPVTVKFKNENVTAYRGDRLLAMVPDLICAVQDDGTPLTNADIREGMKLTYLGFRASEQIRSQAMFNLFKPILEASGCSEDFVPIERLS